MTENERLLTRKGDMVLADLNTAGRLTAQQFNRFMQKLTLPAPLLDACRVVPMTRPDQQINKIGIGGQVLRPAATEGLGEGLAQSLRTQPTFTQILLTTVEMQAEIVIPYRALEDNLEGDNLSDSIIDLSSRQVGVNLEAFALLSTTGNANPTLALMPGWLEKCTLSITDAENVKLSKDVLLNVEMELPDQYAQNDGSYRHIVSRKNELYLRSTFADRQTAFGDDSSLQNKRALQVLGTNVMQVPQMPAASGLYTDPKNLILGVHREILIEVDRDIRGRVFFVVMTIRAGTAVEEEEGAVKVTNIANPQL